MIKPEPYKLVCPKCGFSKIVKPQSDAFTSSDSLPFCSKCKTTMKEVRDEMKWKERSFKL